MCSFALAAGKESILIDELEIISQQNHPFTLQPSGLSYFPSSSTLFLAFDNPLPYIQLQQHIVSTIKISLPALKRNMAIAAVPHLTLAKGISPGEAEDLVNQLTTPGSWSAYSFSKLSLMIEQGGKMREMRSWLLK